MFKQSSLLLQIVALLQIVTLLLQIVMLLLQIVTLSLQIVTLLLQIFFIVVTDCYSVVTDCYSVACCYRSLQFCYISLHCCYRWKLIEGKAGKPNGWSYPPTEAEARTVPRGRQPTLQLFDLERDPIESRNLASQKQWLVRRLSRKLRMYGRGLVPSSNAPPLRNAHPRFFNNTWSPGFCSS